MGQDRFQEQRRLIEDAISRATDSTLRDALAGTIRYTHSLCRATLNQYSRRVERRAESPRDYDLEFIERHMLLEVAHDTVSHVAVVERLLARLGDPRDLPPDDELRGNLRQVRNLLAAHRDEHFLYWRLTGEHTPHVKEVYTDSGLPEPTESIDKEIIAYFPEPGKTEQEIEAGYDRVGTVGGLLSLRKLFFAFTELEAELDAFAERYRT